MKTVAHLAEAINPHRYTLSITPSMEHFTFVANEEIEFELLAPAKTLVFHAAGLKIDAAQLDSKLLPTGISTDAQTQTISFSFNESIPSGRHKLKIEFTGPIQDSLHGFYRSRYELNGETKYLMTTQFEAIHAREALVCIDEPAAKAVFELELVVPNEQEAIANTEIVSQESADNGSKRVRFAPTPKMSTYLLAFIIGQLAATEATTPEGITVRIWATPDKKEQTRFALDVAVRILSFFSSYFEIAYPLTKLDLIAIPDFGAGAMENWGAVTYRETTLLVEEGVSSQRNRQWVAMVVGHELAHQWFGNLVTMAWWNDLWLNEGFASWIEYLAVDKLFPEWKMWTEFLTDDFASAQALDSLANTHPIEVDVPDPAMLDEIFDAISYAKGASIIRMLHDYLGAETFRHGLVSYLKHHQYGNATTADLWAALEEASGRPVGRIMGAWTSQAGFPLVTLEAGKLKQQRFLISPKQKAEDTLWPLTIKALGQSDLAELESENTQAPSGWQKAPWLKLNPGQTGFYHVLYRQQQLADLVGALQNKGLSDVDRWGVVDDVFATIAAGKLGSDTGLELLQVMQGDEDYIVWDGLRAGLGSLIAIANNEDTYEQLRTFGRWLIMPLSKRLGWEPAASEELFTTLLRLDTLMLAGSLGVEAVVAEARRRFQQGAIPADLRTGIYYTIGRNGDATDYEKLRRLYLNSSSQPQEAARLLGALGCFKQSDLADKTLDMLMDTQVVRPQDAVHGLATLLGNHHTGQQTWEFIQANWPELLKRYGSGGHMLSALPLYIAHALKTSEAAEEMVRFFKTNPHPAMARPIRQAEERVRLRVAWWRRDQDAIEQWLTNWEAGL